MKRNAGAQASESKLESRFAALTSGLLARKGSAAPSNSPIEDPAEETVAFTLEPTRKAKKDKDAAAAKAKAESPKSTKPAPEKSAPAQPAQKKPDAQLKSAKKEEPKKAEQKPAAAPKSEEAEPLVVINERSMEAGYPDNPSPEEIAALEAEADEVVSYFENFGSEDAVALEKNDFYGDNVEDEDDDEEEAVEAGNFDGEGDVLDEIEDLDDLDDLEDDEEGASGGVTVAGPWAGASVPPVATGAFEVKAGVTVQLTAREFMRLSLGAAELGETAQDLIVEAIEDYLDARGVLSLGGCSCLEALTKKPDGA